MLGRVTWVHSHTERLLTGLPFAQKLLSHSLIFLVWSCRSLWRTWFFSHRWSSLTMLVMWRMHLENLLFVHNKEKISYSEAQVYWLYPLSRQCKRTEDPPFALKHLLLVRSAVFSLLVQECSARPKQIYVLEFLPSFWALWLLFGTRS